MSQAAMEEQERLSQQGADDRAKEQAAHSGEGYHDHSEHGFYRADHGDFDETQTAMYKHQTDWRTLDFVGGADQDCNVENGCYEGSGVHQGWAKCAQGKIWKHLLFSPGTAAPGINIYECIDDPTMEGSRSMVAPNPKTAREKELEAQNAADREWREQYREEHATAPVELLKFMTDLKFSVKNKLEATGHWPAGSAEQSALVYNIVNTMCTNVQTMLDNYWYDVRHTVVQTSDTGRSATGLGRIVRDTGVAKRGGTPRRAYSGTTGNEVEVEDLNEDTSRHMDEIGE